MNVNERIRAVGKHFFNTNGDFAERIGRNRQFITNIIRDGYNVSLSTLDLIGDKIPELNRVWLITGEGSMLGSVDDLSEAMQSNRNGVKFFELSDELFTIQAPFISGDEYERFLNECKTFKEPNLDGWKKGFFISSSIDNYNYAGFEIQGNAMASKGNNSLEHGDVVFCNEVDVDTLPLAIFPSFHPYWIIVHKDGIICRSIDFSKISNKQLLCKVTNPSIEFSDIVLDLKDVLKLYNIRKKITSMD